MTEILTKSVPARRRRWLQVSLRTRLILMLFAAIAFGWAGMVIQRAREQNRAIQAIKELGADVLAKGKDASSVHKWLLETCGLSSQAASYSVEFSRATDAELVHLDRLDNLRSLELIGCNITNAGMVHVERLTELTSLNLCQTRVTDSGLAHLEKLKRLNYLSLTATRISDAGIAHLASIKSLHELYLIETNLTDAGLMHLKGMTELRKLTIIDTQVTAAGIAELKKALPRLKIIDKREPEPAGRMMFP